MIYIPIIILNLFILFYIKKINNFYNLYDYANSARKIHKHKTPVSGGLILLLNLILTYFIYIYLELNNIPNSVIPFNSITIISFISFFLIGYIDDRFNLPALNKLFFVIIASYLMLFFDNQLLLSNIEFRQFNISFQNIFISYFLTIFCFVAIVNAFNMFDGINLQLGSLSCVIIIILIFSNPSIHLLFILLIAVLVFIYFNYQGKIFFGDSGSILIAVLIGSNFIYLHNNHFIISDTILSILFLPGVDMIRLFITRIKNKKNPFEPDKNHIHHMIIHNYSNRFALFVNITFTLISFIIFKISPILILNILFVLIIYLLMFNYFKKRIKV